MKGQAGFNIRSFSVLLLALIFAAALGKPATVYSASLQRFPDSYEYGLSMRYLSYSDYTQAAMHLYAYIDHNPAAYANNTNGHRDMVKKAINTMVNNVHEQNRYITWIQNEIAKCGRLPCPSQPGSKGSSALPSLHQEPVNLTILDDLVGVCADPYYRSCQFLNVGAYNTPASFGLSNDSISSLLVGAKVKLRLCLNSNLSEPCKTFTGDVADLAPYGWNTSNGFLTIDNNTSSIEVLNR